jgi:predicted secreted protein
VHADGPHALNGGGVSSQRGRQIFRCVSLRGLRGVVSAAAETTETIGTLDALSSGGDANLVQVRDRGRSGWRLADFAERTKARQAKLTQAEVAAVRLYSSFARVSWVLNDALRTRRPDDIQSWATTICFLTSAIIKLSQLASPDATVYSGMPPCTFSALETFAGCRSAAQSYLQYGFLPSTLDPEQNALYCGGKYTESVVWIVRSTFSSRPADISSISMYPEECELLFPPCTTLEIIAVERLEKLNKWLVLVRPHICAMRLYTDGLLYPWSSPKDALTHEVYDEVVEAGLAHAKGAKAGVGEGKYANHMRDLLTGEPKAAALGLEDYMVFDLLARLEAISPKELGATEDAFRKQGVALDNRCDLKKIALIESEFRNNKDKLCVQMATANGDGKWRRQMATANGDGKWRRQMATANGDGKWRRQMATANGDGKWRRQMATANGDGKWRRQMATANGDGKWRRQMATANGDGKWRRQMATANGDGKWRRQMATANGDGKWRRQMATANGDGKWRRQMATANGDGKWRRQMATANGDGKWRRQMATANGDGKSLWDWFDYVAHQAASAESVCWGNRDTGHDGMRLVDFLETPQAKKAKLGLEHILVLRFYTATPVSFALNAPLRNFKRDEATGLVVKPIRMGGENPFPVTVTVLSEAIKRLRDSEGKKVVILWRGLKNMNLEHDSDFLLAEGVEMSCMSTSYLLKTALFYSHSSHSIIFKIVTRSFMERGADLEWISCFPEEKVCPISRSCMALARSLARFPAVFRLRSAFTKHLRVLFLSISLSPPPKQECLFPPCTFLFPPAARRKWATSPSSKSLRACDLQHVSLRPQTPRGLDHVISSRRSRRSGRLGTTLGMVVQIIAM